LNWLHLFPFFLSSTRAGILKIYQKDISKRYMKNIYQKDIFIEEIKVLMDFFVKNRVKIYKLA